MRIAVEGCGHGMLNAIYASVEEACSAAGWDGVDLLIIGGDFQATRNSDDLTCMAVPIKYREMGDFHEYYSGARKAPFLTIFVGGNHEASNHCLELFYGGWIAPNIYYMGAAGVIRCGLLRIAGLSGIWKGYDYKKPHRERLPFDKDDIKSVYHVREYDVTRLSHIRTQVDIGISHDWPRGVEWMGDSRNLFRIKPFFEEEARSNTLGNPVARDLLDHLRPTFWFSAHLHCKYAAVINHRVTNMPQLDDAINAASDKADVEGDVRQLPSAAASGAGNNNPEEIEIDDDIDTVAPVKTFPLSIQGENSSRDGLQNIRYQLPASFNATTTSPPSKPMPTSISNSSTRFLALDKCLPGRHFLQLLEIDPFDQSEKSAKSPCPLMYDKEWLALNRVFSNSLSFGPTKTIEKSRIDDKYLALIGDAEAWVEENIVAKGRMEVPQNFEITVPVHDSTTKTQGILYDKEYMNPQTAAFCEMLQMPNPFPLDTLGRGSSDSRIVYDESVRGQVGHQASRGHRGRGRGQSSQRHGHRGKRGY